MSTKRPQAAFSPANLVQEQEIAVLRQSDRVKTAVLRAVSHDTCGRR